MSDLSERLKSLLLHVEDILAQARKEPFDPPYVFPRRTGEDSKSSKARASLSRPLTPRITRCSER